MSYDQQDYSNGTTINHLHVLLRTERNVGYDEFFLITMSVSRPTLGQARRLETAQISLNRSFNVELLDTKSFNRPFSGIVLTDLDLSHKLLTTSNSYSIINTVQDVLFYDHETGVISGQKVKT